jgi:hypothetical protein
MSSQFRARGLLRHIVQSLHVLYKLCKIGRSPLVRKGLYSWERNSFSSVSPLKFERGDFNSTSCNRCICCTSCPSFVEIGKEQRHLYSWERISFSSVSPLTFERGDFYSTWCNPCMCCTSCPNLVEIGNKGIFTLENIPVFPQYLLSFSSAVTSTAHRAILACAVQTVQVWSRSVCKKGNFTLDNVTVFPQYLPSHSSEGNSTAHRVIATCAVKDVEVWSKSVSKKGNFTLENISFSKLGQFVQHMQGLQDVL